MLLPVPEVLGPIEATLFNPVGTGIRWAVDLPQTGPGDTLAVLGPGIRGLAAVAAAKDAGVEKIMVTGWGENDHARLELAQAFGADVAVDSAAEDPVEAARTMTGGTGVSVVVDMTANAPAALGQAVRMASQGGRIVVGGLSNSAETPGFVPDTIALQELTIIGALGVDGSAYRRALELVASDAYPFRDVPRTVTPITEAADVLLTMAGETGADRPVHAVLTPHQIRVRKGTCIPGERELEV